MRKHALVVGINRYEDLANIHSLQFAEQDAGRVAGFLRDRAGFTVTELIGTAARRVAISGAVERLCSELGQGDLFVCYFAGHALEEVHGQLLLLAADVRLAELKQGAYGDTVPLRALESATALAGVSRVFLLDVCQAPLEGGGGVVELTPSVVQDTRDLCRTASENPPLAIAYSCGEHQKAYSIVDPEVNGGAFSYSLLQALNDRLKAGRELVLPADLEEVAGNCRQLLERHMFGCRQDPWCAANRDRVLLLEGARFLPEDLGEQEWQKETRLRKRDEAVAAALRRAAGDKQEAGHATSWKLRLPLRRAVSQKQVEERRRAEEAAQAQKAAEDERRQQEAQRQAQLKRGKLLRWTLGIALGLGVALAAWFAIPPRQSALQGKQVPAGTTAPPQTRPGTVAMEFVSIPPGEFVMGCSPGDDSCYADEEPAHAVNITKGFEMGKYEVTQLQWMSVMGSNPSNFKGADRPVENVSWADVQQFLEKTNARGDGYHYRLPTEAEWEYAARAGSTPSHLGSLDAFAWYDGNSIGQTHPVGQKQPNAWGLYDVQGNVWEWVADWYGSYSVGPQKKGRPVPSVKDPVSQATSGTGRVVRGGSWVTLTYDVRLSARFTFTPENHSNNIGLRCVREKSR